MQLELAHLPTNSRHVIASKSGHIVNRDEPEVIVAAIQQAVMNVRDP